MGLTLIAKEAGLKTELQPGEFIMFMNSAGDKLKVLCANNILIYLRSKGRIEPLAIRYLPNCFNGNTFDLNRATMKALKTKLTIAEAA